MRLAPIILFTVLLLSPAFAQKNWPEADIRVNGIGSGSSYSQILRKIGRPYRTVDKGVDDECAGGKLKELIYRGLTIGILSDAKGRNFSVYSIEINSNKWSIQHGIKIGSTRKTVISKLGKPIIDKAEPHMIRYVTKENLGIVAFTFRNGKLVRISMQETLC